MGPSGITYGGLSTLNISLGSGLNTFTVGDTAAGTTTTLNSGTGEDTVTITTTSSPLTVNTQAGKDTQPSTSLPIVQFAATASRAALRAVAFSRGVSAL